MRTIDPPPPPTIEQALHTAEQRLAPSSDSARLDAELLLEFVIGIGRAKLRADARTALALEQSRRFEALIARRQKGEPVAYILGMQGLWTLELEVSPAVLIPRPETELVVERALAHVARDASERILDLGTGSGAIALALASERPQAKVVAVDRSPEALKVAARNAERLRLNVELHQGDWYAPLGNESFDVIASNPPYVDAAHPELAPNVRAFEPGLALFAEDGGYACLERIIRDAPRHLRPGGWLILEHGYDQAARVRSALLQSGFTQVRSSRDLAGHERVSEGRTLTRADARPLPHGER